MNYYDYESYKLIQIIKGIDEIKRNRGIKTKEDQKDVNKK